MREKILLQSDIIDDLDSKNSAKPLSARQGQLLLEKIEKLEKRVKKIEEGKV